MPAGRLRPLNRPEPVRVVPAGDGGPARVRLAAGWRGVETILEAWRIDDEWWRETISRAYFSLVLEGGAHLTLYHDLVEGRWYLQPE